jgi:hypothetical protein
MDLFKISSKYFFKAGFDHTLISRWRTGKRRLMPGRRQVGILAVMLCEIDKKQEFSILERLMNTWYPAAPCRDEAEKQELLERFLTEKGQIVPEYQRIREARLGYLRNYEEEVPFAPRGIEAVRLGLLDFLDLIGASPESRQIYLVITEGLSKYFDDKDFSILFMKKLMKLFEAGYRLKIAARGDRAMSDAWDFHRIHLRLSAHLQGYIRTQLYDDFRQQGDDKILGMAGKKFAFRVTRENMWDFDNTYINIYRDHPSVAEVAVQIREYFSRARPVVHYGFFDDPNGWLSNITIYKEHPCYLFTRLPHFGIAPQEELAGSLALTEEERLFLLRVAYPLTLDPAYFNESTMIRHIFCETDIENALLKKRHQAQEASTMLRRKVWMTTHALALQLSKIQAFINTRANYEVCFLNDEHIPDNFPQIYLWGNEATISWIRDKPAMVSRHGTTVAAMQSFCSTVWENIPAAMRSRSLAIRKLNQWMKKLKSIS